MFRAKCCAPLKLTELLRLWVEMTSERLLNMSIEVLYLPKNFYSSQNGRYIGTFLLQSKYGLSHRGRATDNVFQGRVRPATAFL